MITISALLPGADERSQSARLNDAENQRNAWLRQMELAQLSEMGKLDVPGDAQARDAGLQNGAQQGTSQAYAGAAATGGVPVLTQSRLAPAYSAPEGAQSDADSLASGESGDADSAAATPDNATRGAGPSQLSGSPVMQSMAGVPVTSLRPANQNPAAAAIAELAGEAQSLPEQQTATSMLQSVQPRPAAALGAPAAMSNGEMQDASVQEQTAPEESSGAESAQEEKPAWEKRLIHLTSEGNNVDVWIRDTALNPGQSANLVSRLASDIAGTGMRLRGATVNGKPAFRSGSTTANNPQMSSMQQTLHTDSNSSTIANPEEDHGA